MKNITIFCLLALMLFACSSEQVTCNCYDPNKIDSIMAFSVIKDSVYVDVPDSISSYPKIDTSYSMVKIEDVVQVRCGYPKFLIHSDYDTLIVAAKTDSGKECVDWTAKFKYVANISVIGKCKFVRFKNSESLSGSSQDSTLRI